MTAAGSLADWAALVPPPDRAPTPVDWAAQPGPLPRDYRAYIDTYGLGSVNQLFWVLHPDGVPDRLNLAAQWAAAGDPAVPLLTPPPPGRLLPCAIDEDGGILHWQADDPDPDRWTVVYRDEDGDSWLPYGLGLVAFLHAVFTGALPELGYGEAGFLDPPIRFVPLG